MRGRLYPGLTREAVEARSAALDRFARWQASNPARLTPAEALAAAGALYEMLPEAGRQRPVDPSGVMAFHSILSRAWPASR